MPNTYKLLIFSIASLLLSACATIHPDYEEPEVTVSAFRAIPSQSLAPRFEIILHIINPNRVPLNLEGISYSIHIEGHKIISGVANDLPTIKAYDDADITLLATTDLFGSIQLIADLMQEQREELNYQFSAKLDPGRLYRSIRVIKEGTFSLAGNRKGHRP